MYNILTTTKSFFLSLLETDQKDKDNFFKFSLSMLFIIIMLILINLIVISSYPDNSEALLIQAKKLIIEPDHFKIWPEPVEQFQILTSLFFTPILVFCSLKIFSSRVFNRISITDAMHYLNVALWFSLLAIMFYLSFKLVDPNSWPPSYFYGIRRYFYEITSGLRFLITLIIFPLIAYFIFNGIPKQYTKLVNGCLYSLILFFLLMMFLLSTCNSVTYLGTGQNLNVVLYSVSQVQQGKILLSDFTAQYGLYAHFLYPLFKLINVNIVSFSATMAALTVLSYSLIFFALRKIISNNLIVFFSFIAIIYFSYYTSFFNGPWFDIAYASNPIRRIFPALIIFLGFSYIINPKKILYLLIIFLSSLAMLWNFETGVICFLSFYIYVLYEKLAVNNLRSYVSSFIKHSIISASILTLTFFLFSIIIYLQSGSFPNWSLFFKYASVFGMTGFMAMPMPIFHAWNLVFLVYVYGIYIGLKSILSNKKNILDRAAFFLAIFGLGISSYYLNRSHDFNLFPILYPSFILLAIYLSKVLDHSKRANIFKIKNFLSVLVISFILMLIFAQMLRPIKLFNIVADRMQVIMSNTINNKFISNGIDLIKLNALPSEQIIILFADERRGWTPGPDGSLHLETNTSSPLPTGGSDELSIKSDWDLLNQFLATNISYKVFIDFTDQKKYHPLMKIIDDNYYLDSWLGDWRMFVPKKYESLTQSAIKAIASYSEFCPKNSSKCKDTVNGSELIENFPKNKKYIKIDFKLSESITLQSIMLHLIDDLKYAGSITTLPYEDLWNIGILDNMDKKFINTEARSDQLNYKVNQNFSVLIPDTSDYIKKCDPFIIELIYNDNKKLKVRATCR